MLNLHNSLKLRQGTVSWVLEFGTARLQAKHLWMEVKLRWNVLAGRMYTKAPTGKSREQLNALHSTRLLGAATRIPMRKKPIVDQDLQRSRHGGSNAKSGWNTSRVTVYLGFLTSRVVYRFSRARRKLLVLRRHLWNIVQRGRPKRALTSSSDVDSCRM